MTGREEGASKRKGIMQKLVKEASVAGKSGGRVPDKNSCLVSYLHSLPVLLPSSLQEEICIGYITRYLGCCCFFNKVI